MDGKRSREESIDVQSLTLDRLKNIQQVELIVDGCTAAVHVAYCCSEAAFIFPITPSSSMAEAADGWAHQGRRNAFGEICCIRQMQSEGGAAGALHGGVVIGTCCTTFTSSQGLLLMIPNLYKIAGELQPCVIHVAARALAGQALSIFGDHSDVMMARACGWTMLSSTSVQESMDLAFISHCVTYQTRVPVMHFFDGFRTSHELQKIKVLPYELMAGMMPWSKIQEHRERGLNPTRPHLVGTSQGPDIFFQNVEAANKYYNAVPEAMQRAMDEFGMIVGRKYQLYAYHGSPDATRVVVIMGAAACVVKEVVDYLMERGEKVGVVTIHLYRPWALETFLKAVPFSAKKIAVLDRTKEVSAMDEPLCMDVRASFHKMGRVGDIIGGRYGLGSKDFTGAHALRVFLELNAANPKQRFTIGITDDVTNLSLEIPQELEVNTVPKGTHQCMFWGMGSDGTVGANKNVIKILGDATDMYVQGYFAYTAHKAGGVTVSHLRFGPQPITSQYLIQHADYVAVHRDSYAKHFNVLSKVNQGGTFLLNCHWTDEEMDVELPGRFKRQMASKDLKFFAIDAGKIAKEIGMGRRINNILMTVFFKLSGILPIENAISLFKTAIKKTYGKKGQHVVDMNYAAVDAALDKVREVRFDREKWLVAPDVKVTDARDNGPQFVTNVLMAIERFEGDDLPVSKFNDTAGGILPLGTAAYEKRGIALSIPIVDMDKCTQCNYCAFVCPHAAIRPFLVTEDEAESAPEGFVMKKAKGAAEIQPYRYRIQVAPQDCTGCQLCAVACPDDALAMTAYEDCASAEDPNWEFAIALECRGEMIGSQARQSVKGSQFHQPLLEFSGACEGCGETPYVKLLTQLFGERMVIANATGCTSIWGASYPSVPYTKNQKGYGPAWGNSLFEDNAEYGFGMVVASNHRRSKVHMIVSEIRDDTSVKASPELRALITEWVDKWQDGDACQRLYEEISKLLEQERYASPKLMRLYNEREMLVKFSNWMIGGDGWAYDIGYGGLDHVIASGENVNILVVDTEVYSNTGGQVSKATPFGAVHKFATGGHLHNKKDLGLIAMEYGNVYVASVNELANMTQTVRAIVEAESYDGPSLVICYAPCIEHNYIKPFSLQQMHCKMTVDTGYWPLYRFDPRLARSGQNPFQLDSKKLRGDLKELLHKENRFATLWRTDPKIAQQVEDEVSRWAKDRFERLKQKAEGVQSRDDSDRAQTGKGTDDQRVGVFYGSETGNTEEVARRIVGLLKERGLESRLFEFADVTVEEVAEFKQVLLLCCTQGQGEFPENAKEFWGELSKDDLPSDTFADTSFAVFGLGDSSYIYFCHTAKKLDERMGQLGGKRLLPYGKGDDQDPEKYETALGEWLPDWFQEIKAPEPKTSEDPDPSNFKVIAATEQPYRQCVPMGAKLVEVTCNRRLTPEDYDVDVRHVDFDLSGTGLKYSLGDSFAIWPHNDPDEVEAFCQYIGYDADEMVKIEKATDESSPKHEALFQHPMTIRQLFTECLDIFGRPPRRFYEALWKHCVDHAERKACRALLEKQNKETFGKMSTKQMVNIWDVLKMYPSARPSVPQLIDLVPLIRPRYYSIASSMKFVGETKLELCIGIVDWTTEAGEKRYGQATGHVRRTMVGEGRPKVQYACAVKPTAFNMPPSNMNPIIMAGMGTGLAPFRAFIQHRAYLKRSGKPAGPTSLYFGCRYKAKDFLYCDELQAYEEEGVLTELKVAFSRDQKDKFYVQHCIDKDPAILFQRLITENGFFYLCGSAKQVPIDVRAAIERALVSEGGLTAEDATEKITQMMIKGQYNVEAWG